MTIRPDDLMEQAMREMAQAEHLSKHEVLRAAVLERWERQRHRTDVAASTARMTERWGDVLDRLGRA
jgi:predicted transcriptional regulator